MVASPRTSQGSIWDLIGYAALVLIAILAGVLYFDEPAPLAASPSPLVAPVAEPAETLIQRLTRQASAGDVVSQRQLGEAYQYGISVPPDDAESFKWLKLAGDRGDMIAARMLGFLYTRGKGVSVDRSEAIGWFRLASDKGDAVSAYELARAHMNGEGVVKSQAEGLSYCRLAAERGNANAQYFMGYWYYQGFMVSQSHSEAYAWFRKAAVQGHGFAQNQLGIMHRDGQSVPASDVEAAKWFGFASNHYSAEGSHNLAQLYSQGRGMERDEGKAADFFLKGAMLGYPASQTEVGRRHATGLGVAVDRVESFAWYEVAAGSGSAEAGVARDQLLRSLSVTDVSAGRTRAEAIRAQIESEKNSRKAP